MLIRPLVPCDHKKTGYRPYAAVNKAFSGLLTAIEKIMSLYLLFF